MILCNLMRMYLFYFLLSFCLRVYSIFFLPSTMSCACAVAYSTVLYSSSTLLSIALSLFFFRQSNILIKLECSYYYNKILHKLISPNRFLLIVPSRTKTEPIKLLIDSIYTPQQLPVYQTQLWNLIYFPLREVPQKEILIGEYHSWDCFIGFGSMRNGEDKRAFRLICVPRAQNENKSFVKLRNGKRFIANEEETLTVRDVRRFCCLVE